MQHFLRPRRALQQAAKKPENSAMAPNTSSAASMNNAPSSKIWRPTGPCSGAVNWGKKARKNQHPEVGEVHQHAARPPRQGLRMALACAPSRLTGACQAPQASQHR